MQEHNIIRQNLASSAELTLGTLEPILGDIEQAGQIIAQCFLDDRKLLCCGSASSVAIGEYFSAILSNRLEHDRPGLPSQALSGNSALHQSISDLSSQHEVYARQIRSTAKEGDTLIIFGASTDSAALLQAISASHDKGVKIIAITGMGDGNISSILTPDDCEIPIHTTNIARLVEAELLISHSLCNLIEFTLFSIGGEE